MSRALISWALALVALVAMFVLQIDSRAEGPAKPTVVPIEKSPNDNQTDKTPVERALAEPADFNFTDTPLKDVASFVADHYKINVLLDLKSLADAGVTADTPITERIKGVPLRSALRHALENKDLSYFERDDNVLSITTADVAKTRTTIQTYDVRKFASPVNEFSAEATPWDRVAEIIKSTVVPTWWMENGGIGSLKIADGNIVVSQTDEIHSQIADLLSQLEAASVLAPAPENRELPTIIPFADAPEKKIMDALESRHDFAYADIPLKDFVSALQSQLGIQIMLDTKALADAGITGDSKISMRFKQIRTRVALHISLATLDLAFIIDHDVLLITTADVSKTKTVTYVYPVGDLVSGVPLGPTGVDPYVNLQNTISALVAPGAWDENGGAGSIMAFPVCKVLLISQTQELHQEVKELLATLRATRKRNPPSAPVSTNTWSVRIYSLSSEKSGAAADEKGAEQLVDMIRKLVEPKSWSDPQAYVGAVRGQIVVRQMLANHNRIHDLIAAIDEASATKNKPAPPVESPNSTGIPAPTPK